MAATLDLKSPTAVIVGQWNPAILSDPAWLDKHALAVPEGQDVDLQVFGVGGAGGGPAGLLVPDKHILIFENFGICCNGPRLELYIRTVEDRRHLYPAISRLLETLPHTPIRAVGVNFDFLIEDDIAAPVASQSTQEPIDAFGTRVATERSDSFLLPRDIMPNGVAGDELATTLNLTRKSDFNTMEISLNYHTPAADGAVITQWCDSDSIGHWHAHALSALDDVYGITEVASTYF